MPPTPASPEPCLGILPSKAPRIACSSDIVRRLGRYRGCRVTSRPALSSRTLGAYRTQPDRWIRTSIHVPGANWGLTSSTRELRDSLLLVRRVARPSRARWRTAAIPAAATVPVQANAGQPAGSPMPGHQIGCHYRPAGNDRGRCCSLMLVSIDNSKKCGAIRDRVSLPPPAGQQSHPILLYVRC